MRSVDAKSYVFIKFCYVSKNLWILWLKFMENSVYKIC